MTRKPQRFCMFCSGWHLSKEHVWPQWAKDMLPDSPAYTAFRATGEESPTIYRVGQGPVSNVKLRVACKTCNNEWMSALEEAAKPLLTPMIVGERIQLTEDRQRTIAEWIALKMMVIEQSHPPDVVVSQDERTAFYKDRTIPANMRIRIAICGEGVWRSATRRETRTISAVAPRAGRPISRNVQFITFGIGDLLIHSTVCNAPGFDIDEAVPVNAGVLRLWPPSTGTVDWPMHQAYLDATAAGVLSKRADVLSQHPNIIKVP